MKLNTSQKQLLKNITISLIIFLVTLNYTYFIKNIETNEILTYGFSQNIAKGLIPYKDFNMTITPLYEIIGAITLKIFSYRLIIFHIINALGITILIHYLQKKIGLKAYIMYFLSLIAIHVSSIFLTLLLFLWILLLEENTTNSKFKPLKIGLLASFLFLTNQTIGLLILIPVFIYSKNKKMTLASIEIPILIFFSYLFLNDSLHEFIDYCFLRIFDFSITIKPFSLLIIPEIAIIIHLIYKLIKSRGKDKETFYVLVFQIISFPIINQNHFFITLIPYIYINLKNINLTKKNLIILCSLSLVLTISLEWKKDYANNPDFKLYQEHNFLYLRKINNEFQQNINFLEIETKKYNQTHDYVFNFSNPAYAYIIKLITNDTITKFDLTNKSNMGYQDENKYIEEIKNICQNNTCIFITNEIQNQDETSCQTSQKILTHIFKNYKLEKTESGFNFYTNYQE